MIRSLFIKDNILPIELLYKYSDITVVCVELLQWCGARD